ncbi:MAG: shikimate kinase [Desulfamplus sp.]|nr:shikimate kinase [Desulfamplus sp.]MBF0412458.1 shikimate kinase [Desulfamplus sp.]
MTNNNIILTGFMGTGKSTVGKLLAEKMGYKFVDTDETIMSRCNMSVAEIFKSQGEALFRKMERELALELSTQERLVISTGGGMLLDSVNAEALEGKKSKGKIFCLIADPDEIIARVSSDNTIERPLLKVADPKARMAELLQERKERYSRFIQLDTTGITPEAVCSNIIDMLNNNQF